jgi:hypothetical protein
MMVRDKQRGTILIMAAIMLPVLLAGLGLVIDNGQAYEMKRRLQSAADAVPPPRPTNCAAANTTKFEQIVIDNVARNGFTASNTDIKVYNPPKTGKRVGDKNYVEVVLRHEAPLYFMKPFYDSQLMVEARAIGGVRPTEVCILVLNKTASSALLVAGNAYVDVSKCAVQVDSNSSTAARSNGGATLLAARTDVVGKYSGNAFKPTPNTGQPNIDDPLAAVPAPTFKKCTGKVTTLKIGGSSTLSPGTFCGGIEITSGAVATLNAGLYIMAGGGLTIRGGGTIKGDGVTIFNTSSGSSSFAPIDMAGGATAKLTAPTTGTYKGIIFFGDRTITSGKANQITSNSDSYYTGTLYFPSQTLTYIGSAMLDNQKMLIIADTVEFQGNVKVTALTANDGVSPYIMEASLVY